MITASKIYNINRKELKTSRKCAIKKGKKTPTVWILQTTKTVSSFLFCFFTYITNGCVSGTMVTATRVKILDETVSVSLTANILGKV